MARRFHRVHLDRDTVRLLEELQRIEGGTYETVMEHALHSHARQLGLHGGNLLSSGLRTPVPQIDAVGRDSWVCPSCHSLAVIPIKYGPLTSKLSVELEAGECIYGGRVLSDDSPEFACSVCGAQFDAPKVPKAEEAGETDN